MSLLVLNDATVEAPAGTNLLTWLRDRGLVAAKPACRGGDCGACHVLLGERAAGASEPVYRAVNSCLLRTPASHSRLLTQTHRPGTEHASGLRCGGEQLVALTVLDATATGRLKAVDETLSRGETIAWEVSGAGWHHSHVSGPSHRRHGPGG